MSTDLRMMSVADILRRATGSLDMGIRTVGGGLDWFAILAGKVSHAHFDNLCDTIMRDGFLLPIVLVRSGETVFGKDTYTVGNGHHRLCAAILLGLTAIPVLINDGDYWAFEESHDEEWNPGERSFDYWEMLESNIPDGYYGDKYNEVHRAQFANRPDASAEDDSYRREDLCDGCGGCASCCAGMCNEPEACHYCDRVADEYEEHAMGCPEREWEIIGCGYMGSHGWGHGEHYRKNACHNLIADWHAEALAENAARNPAAWHPAAVLQEAYAEHEEWQRAQAYRVADRAWRDAVQAVRDAVNRAAGDYALAHYCQLAYEAEQALNALQ